MQGTPTFPNCGLCESEKIALTPLGILALGANFTTHNYDRPKRGYIYIFCIEMRVRPLPWWVIYARVGHALLSHSLDISRQLEVLKILLQKDAHGVVH